jgi:hypothetical protein
MILSTTYHGVLINGNIKSKNDGILLLLLQLYGSLRRDEYKQEMSHRNTETLKTSFLCTGPMLIVATGIFDFAKNDNNASKEPRVDALKKRTMNGRNYELNSRFS